MIESRSKGINVPEIFKQRGLDHVRLRITDEVATGSTLLGEIVACVDECLQAGLVPMVAYQAGGFKDDPLSDDALNQVVAWWRSVDMALPARVPIGLNLVIETTGDLLKNNNSRLNLLYKTIADDIMTRGNNRILLYAPNKISSPLELPRLVVPDPIHVAMAEFHMFAAGPNKSGIPKDKVWTTGTFKEKQDIAGKINYAAEWSSLQGIPLYFGALMVADYNDDDNTGATYYDGAPASISYSIEEQKVFAKFFCDLLRTVGIPFAVNSDTKYYNRDTNEWYESVSGVLDVILGIA